MDIYIQYWWEYKLLKSLWKIIQRYLIKMMMWRQVWGQEGIGGQGDIFGFSIFETRSYGTSTQFQKKGENVELVFRVDVTTKYTQLRSISKKYFSAMSDIKYKFQNIIEQKVKEKNIVINSQIIQMILVL